MEKEENLLNDLQLSEAEKKSVRIGSGVELKGNGDAAPLKAFGTSNSQRGVSVLK